MRNYWLNKNKSKEIITIGSLVRCKKTGTLMNVFEIYQTFSECLNVPVKYLQDGTYVCQWFNERKLCVQIFTKDQIELERTP